MANLITLLRFPLLFIYVILLYTDNGVLQIWCVPFIVLIILMDMFDGLIARARGEVSLLGSVLDIATDRTFEIILWVVFAHLGLIPVIIPKGPIMFDALEYASPSEKSWSSGQQQQRRRAHDDGSSDLDTPLGSPPSGRKREDELSSDDKANRDGCVQMSDDDLSSDMGRNKKDRSTDFSALLKREDGTFLSSASYGGSSTPQQ